MASRIIECPSGLKGEVRGMKTKELAILASPENRVRPVGKNAAKIRNKHPLDPVLAGCWMTTEDAGPYKLRGPNVQPTVMSAMTADGGVVATDAGAAPTPLLSPRWDQVLLCDRFFVLTQIRDLTYGSYDYPVRCTNPGCKNVRTPFLWALDLNQLEVRALPEESRAKVARGDRVFSMEIAGKAIKFRLLVGDDEANPAVPPESIPAGERMLAQLASRIFEVDGVEGDAARAAWIGELDLGDMEDVRDRMEEVDGGVETSTTAECPECFTEIVHDVPFAAASFLTHTAKKNRK